MRGTPSPFTVQNICLAQTDARENEPKNLAEGMQAGKSKRAGTAFSFEAERFPPPPTAHPFR
jgi:hypothetical protein